MTRPLPVSCLEVSFSNWLSKCLMFRSRLSDLIPKCERQKPLRTRRERSDAPQARLVYNLIIAWVIWKNFYFFVWHFVMTVMSNFLLLPVCRVKRSWHGQRHGLLAFITVATYAIDFMAMSQNVKPVSRPLPIYKSERGVMCDAINICLKTSNDLHTCFRRKTNQLCTCVLVT